MSSFKDVKPQFGPSLAKKKILMLPGTVASNVKASGLSPCLPSQSDFL